MAIDARHVSKSFANYVALRDVDLRVEEGELVALLGPSGSGKTTLLRIIAGLDGPDPNHDTAVIVDGQNILDRKTSERRVGFVFQHYALFRHMTVFENIAFGLRVRPRKLRPSEPDIRGRVHDLLELTQLGRWRFHYPSQLSGGQRQRVGVARALAADPSVLLFDEPFGAVDPVTRLDLQKQFLALRRELGKTAIFVTHDVREALMLATRIALLCDGALELVAPPREFLDAAGAEARAFLACLDWRDPQ